MHHRGHDDAVVPVSSEGRDLLRFYKATQSGENGTGFASLPAEYIVRSRYPDHSVSVIPADVAPKAGWTLRGSGTGARPEPLQRRPHFFVEAWQPGQPSKVLLLSSKGTHSSVHQVQKQLSTAGAHVESMHIGPSGTVPYLLIGTAIPTTESLAVHILEAPGTTFLRPPGETSEADLDLVLGQENRMADVARPTDRGKTTVPGFQVLPDSFAWFSVVLARTEAATLMAFTEAFSGLQGNLYMHLHHGRVNEYRREVHATTWAVAGPQHIGAVERHVHPCRQDRDGDPSPGRVTLGAAGGGWSGRRVQRSPSILSTVSLRTRSVRCWCGGACERTGRVPSP